MTFSSKAVAEANIADRLPTPTHSGHLTRFHMLLLACVNACRSDQSQATPDSPANHNRVCQHSGESFYVCASGIIAQQPATVATHNSGRRPSPTSLSESQFVNVQNKHLLPPSSSGINSKLQTATFKRNVLQLEVDGNSSQPPSSVEKKWSQRIHGSIPPPCLWRQSRKLCGRGEDARVSTRPGKFVCYQMFGSYARLRSSTFKEPRSVKTGPNFNKQLSLLPAPVKKKQQK